MLSLKHLRVLHSLKRSIYVEHGKCAKRMPSSWDIMTGPERWVALQYAKGNTDPFFIEPLKRGPGTKDCPNVVISVFDKRVVGCLCEPDSMSIVWWWLHEGYPRRCKCNHWFILKRIKLPQGYEDCDANCDGM